MKKFIKENIFGFVLSAILFGGITTVVATTILSSSVSYTNNSQTTVESVLDELYYRGYLLNNGIDPRGFNPDGTGGKISFVYWNDNFSNSIYTSLQIPTGSGLNGTYSSMDALAVAYSDWSNAQIYIKTTKVDGTVTGHAVCVWHNNREFCLTPNYWTGPIGTPSETEALRTRAKLKADMENVLGLTNINCSYSASGTDCYAGVFYCGSGSSGNVSCYAPNISGYCRVFGGASATCQKITS